MKNLLFFTFFSFTVNMYGQNKVFNTFNEAIKFHINELKTSMYLESQNIYFTTSLNEIPKDSLSNILYIDDNLNPKSLKYGKYIYLVKFFFIDSINEIKIKAFNFRVRKKSKKHLIYTNLGNGNTYIIRK